MSNYFQPAYFSNYVQGAETIVKSKPMIDGNLDNHIGTTAPTKVREQVKYLNVNGVDIPSVVTDATAKTIGVAIRTQVNSKDSDFNNEAEIFIDEHSELGIGELTNTHHFNSAMRSISDFDLLEGGIIVRHHYNLSWDIPYKYEIVSVDMVDINKDININSTGAKTVSGLVLNKWQQITHVWIYTTSDKTISEKVSISDITYYAEVWHSLAQHIAISKLSRVLPTVDKLGSYAQAELSSAIESAKTGAYWKSGAYNEIMQIVNEIIQKDPNLENKVSKTQQAMSQIVDAGINPNGLTPIPLGDDILFNPSKRDTVFAELNKNSEMKLASAMGSSDLGIYSKADKVNYSAMKYINETDQLKANIRFDNISNKIIKDIHSRLLAVGVSIGRLPNKVEYFLKPSSFNKFEYLRQLHIDIEPAKTAKANEINLKLGLKSRKEIIEQRTGVRYETFIDTDIKSEIYAIQRRAELFKEAGLIDSTVVENNKGNDSE